METVMKQLSRLFFIAILTVIVSLPAYAMDLRQARDAGLIGEKQDGYIAAIKKDTEILSLVKDINEKRRLEYLRISKENNQPIDVVASIAAAEIINSLKKGHYYQDSNGKWKQR